MLQTFLNSFRVAEIRKKLAFTAAMLLLYRVGAYIPAPGIDVDAVESIAENFQGSNVLGFLNLFSGGSLQRFAIFALGIMPYITASIILQLLQVVVPSLEKLRKEGEVGQQKITQYTRYLTVGLAFGQSIGYVFLFRQFGANASTDVVNGGLTFTKVFVIVLALTCGCVLVMWLGELITQRGIGNGISLMIFASIIARIPQGVQSWWTNPDQVFKVMMPFIALGVIAAIVAASLMAFPPTIGQLVQSGWARDFSNFLNPNGAAYVIGESLLIIVFTYFYTAVTFNPVEQA